jgi:4-amino-4-deoxy-L-arabinose transferase-like glycosyltransferase
MKRSAIALFTIALIVRLGLIFGTAIIDPAFFYDDDSAGYISLATNMEKGLGFAWDVGMPFTPDSFRTPGYPLFLMTLHSLFGSYRSALIVQLFLSLGIGWLIFVLGRRYFTERIGLIAAALFLFMPFSLLVSMRYLTQVTFTVSVMLATWAFLEYLKKDDRRYLIAAAIMVPVAALIRPIAILFVAPFVAALILAWLFKTISWKRALGASAIFIIIFIAGVAPWLMRNERVFGTASLSSLMPFQLYFYDDPAIYATAHHLSYDQAKDVLVARIDAATGIRYETPNSSLYYAEFSKITPILVREGTSVAFENIPALIETRIVEFFKFFVRDGIRYWIERYGVDTEHGWGFVTVVIERLVLFVIMVGFFYKATCALLKKDIPIITMTLVVLYFAVLTGVMASAGLRYPAEPLFLLLGVAGLFDIMRRMRKPKTT